MANDREVMKTLASPVRNVFVCNEAFSDDRGWGKRALRSANFVLDKFGIKPLPHAPE